VGAARGQLKSAKQAMKERYRSRRSDHPGRQFDRQPLYGGGLTAWAHGLTSHLCSEGGLAAWACGLTASLCSGRGRTASGGKPGKTRGVGSGAGMGAAQGESSCRKMSKLLVRQGEAEKEKSTS
jgi:hypothetical protein